MGTNCSPRALVRLGVSRTGKEALIGLLGRWDDQGVGEEEGGVAQGEGDSVVFMYQM